MSVGDGASIVEAGWYTDPADPARLRRWDGAQWTQDVILAPEDDQGAFVAPPSAPLAPESLAAPVTVEPPAQPEPPAPAEPVVPPEPSEPPAPPEPTLPPEPAVPVSASASSAPPAPARSPAPTEPPPAPTAAQPATPAVQQMAKVADDRPDPLSDAVSLPDWANLPGLTLPPDLSSLPGMEQSSVLKPPTFEDPKELPAPGWQPAPILAPPTWDEVKDEPPAPAAAPTTAPDLPPPAPPTRGRTPGSERYAPPPAGGQYNVPPPPGAPHVPTTGMLPPSSLVSPGVAAAAWAQPLPPVDQANPTAAPQPGAPSADPAALPPVDQPIAPRAPAAPAPVSVVRGPLTLWAWLIALLPLLQFAGIYFAFAELDVAFAPGMQWGILAAPAAFGVLFAIGDRRKLLAIGIERAPSPLLAVVPPIYLLTRAIEVGRSGIVTLLAWLVFQAAAAEGVYYLLPHLLAQVIRAID